MAKSFSIEAIFKAVDRMSNPMKGITKNTSKMSRAIRTDFARAQRSVDNFTRNFKKNLGQNVKRAAVGFGLTIAVGLGMAAKEYVDFENTITASSAKFGVAFQKGTDGFKQLTDATRQIGATTEFSSTQAAEGLDFLALAGFNAAQSMALLPGVVNLATAAQTDLATASDIASDSLGAFGLATEDSTQLGINFNRVMDVMAKTTTTSNTDLTTLFETVKKGAASFTAAGQSLESFNALAGIMANNGLKGAESGTQLRNIMLRLAKPTDEASKVLKNLGVQTQDQNGNFRDILDIIGDFETGLQGVGTAQKSAALATVFGSRSVTGMNILLSEGAEGLKAYRLQLENSKNASQLMADVMRGSIGNQIATLKSAAIELGFKFVEAFEDRGSTGIKSLTDAINNFDVVPVLENIEKIISLIKNIIGLVIKLKPIIIGVVGAFTLWKIAIWGAIVAQQVMIGILAISKFLQFFKIIMMIAKAKGVWAAAQWALNFAMNANPVGLIITGIAILIGLIYLLVKNWETIITVISKVWEVAKGFLMFFIAPLVFTIELIRSLYRNINMIKEAFTDGGFIQGILAIGKAILSAIISPIQSLLATIGKIPGIGKPFKFMAEGLDSFINKLEGRQKEFGYSLGQAPQSEPVTQAPISSSERGIINREESKETIDLNINDPKRQTTVNKRSRARGSNVKLSTSGGL